jgi:hypothetical protein
MDDADIADREITRATERAIANIRSANNRREKDYCEDCGIELESHRRPYGTCIRCQTKREIHR